MNTNTFFGCLVICILVACAKETTCSLPEIAVLQIGFYEYENSNSQTSQNILNIDIFGIGREDTLLYQAPNDFNEIKLPLNHASDQSEYIIRTESFQDTLVINYQREAMLNESVCGYEVFFDLTEVSLTTNSFDSIAIQVSMVNFETREHVKIFF